MPARQRIDFTEKELDALVQVVGAGMMDVEHMGLGRVEQAAAARAVDKIQRNHRKFKFGTTADPDVFCNSCENRGATYSTNGGLNVTGCTRCGYLTGQHPNGLRNVLINCPHPDHDDDQQSATRSPDGSVFCHGCGHRDGPK